MMIFPPVTIIFGALSFIRPAILVIICGIFCIITGIEFAHPCASFKSISIPALTNFPAFFLKLAVNWVTIVNPFDISPGMLAPRLLPILLNICGNVVPITFTSPFAIFPNAGNRLLRNVPVDVTRFSIDLLTSLPNVKLPRKSFAEAFIMLNEPDMVLAASLAVVPVIPICV